MRKARVLWGVALLAGGLLLTACSSEPAPPTTESLEAGIARVQAEMQQLQAVPEPMRSNIQTWTNFTGLTQLNPDIWQTRLDRACNARFWVDPGIVEALADEFAADDVASFYRDPAAAPVVMVDAYVALWIMALNHCRHLVPPDVAVDGPPHLGFQGDG